MAKAALEAGKHVLLEKPIALTLDEADELIELADAGELKFTIGYSQRFNAKQAMIKRAIDDGTLGEVTSILLSRHITRSLGAKISSRTKLSPAAMEATHDLDFAFWCLEPRRPVRVYSQNAWGVRKDTLGVPDTQYLVVTMDDGVVVTVGAGMSLPPGYPNQSTTWIEVIGTEGAILADASHRDIVLNTVAQGRAVPAVHDAGRVRRPRLRRSDGAGDDPLPRGGRLRPAGDGRSAPGPRHDGGLPRRRPVGRAQPGGRAAARAATRSASPLAEQYVTTVG